MRRSLVAALAAAVLAGGAVVALGARGGPGVPAALPSPSASPDPVRTPLLVPAGTAAPLPTAAGLRAVLAGPLRSPALGGRVGLAVVDAATSATLLELGPTEPVTPASTAKIATALTVLTALPADTRFRTRVVQGAPGDVVLVGGGDPTLAGPNALPGFPRPARLADLAARLHGLVVKRVVVDDSLFAGPRVGPGWKPGYVSEGDVAPVSALAVDEGRTSRLRGSARVADPALEAGRQLAALLHVRTVVRGRAVAGATELSSVASPTVGELVEAMLTRSDNDLAEALGRQAALALHLPPTFDGEAAAGRAVLAPLLAGGTVALRDASGLSPLDKVAPRALARLLAHVGTDPRFGPVLSGLPVAGFDGTLGERFRKAPTSAAAGTVRGKTGTLDGVSALAGLVRTRSGRLLAFDLTADGVPISGTLAAQAALDRVATALSTCGCT